MLPTMRSKASRVTCAEGDAAPHTRRQCDASAVQHADRAGGGNVAPERRGAMSSPATTVANRASTNAA